MYLYTYIRVYYRVDAHLHYVGVFYTILFFLTFSTCVRMIIGNHERVIMLYNWGFVYYLYYLYQGQSRNRTRAIWSE
jgi:hypothetical protein